MPEPSLFSSHPADPVVPALHTRSHPAAALPSAADVVAGGWNPPEWFDRRYPRAARVKSVGGLAVESVRMGTAAPCLRAEFDQFYRRFLGEPVEFPLDDAPGRGALKAEGRRLKDETAEATDA